MYMTGQGKVAKMDRPIALEAARNVYCRLAKSVLYVSHIAKLAMIVTVTARRTSFSHVSRSKYLAN